MNIGSESNFINCQACSAQISQLSRFCPECGSRISQMSAGCENTYPRGKKYLFTLLLSASLVGFSIWLGPQLIGRAPNNNQSPTHASIAAGHPPVSSEVKKITDASVLGSAGEVAKTDLSSAEPLSSEELFLKAEKAVQAIQSTEVPTSTMLLEAVDLLSRILQIEPENPWALVSMAEISFNQKLFDKASDFYERYLKSNPEDATIRTRLASSLTFAGFSQKAIAELETVLKVQPDNFQALAFLAIAHNESGNVDQARQFLSKAIELAPNEEAKVRLLRFSDSLDGTSTTTATEPEIDSSKGTLASLESFLRNHPIAGPKFVAISSSANDIILDFNQFPMEKMPPVVKDKFTQAVAQVAAKSNLNNRMLVFRDTVSKSEMARIEVR